MSPFIACVIGFDILLPICMDLRNVTEAFRLDLMVDSVILSHIVSDNWKTEIFLIYTMRNKIELNVSFEYMIQSYAPCLMKEHGINILKIF